MIQSIKYTLGPALRRIFTSKLHLLYFLWQSCGIVNFCKQHQKRPCGMFYFQKFQNFNQPIIWVSTNQSKKKFHIHETHRDRQFWRIFFRLGTSSRSQGSIQRVEVCPPGWLEIDEFLSPILHWEFSLKIWFKPRAFGCLWYHELWGWWCCW